MQILGRNILISLVMISIILIIKYKNKKSEINYLYNMGIILICISMVVIFSLTGVSPMSGFHLDIRIDEISIIPFAGMISMLRGGITTHAFINIVGNIVMFMPIGFLVPIIYKKLDSYKKIALTGLSISMLIECTQLFLSRGTDIDDLILNTIGTVLGYLVFTILKNLFYVSIEKNIEKQKHEQSKFILYSAILIPYMVTVMFGFYDRFRF